MDEHPTPDDPFGGLPDELRRMLDALSGDQADPSLIARIASSLRHPTAGGPEGPVDWQLARQVAHEVAAEHDREPDAGERARAQEAFALAEHWLDETALPAPRDAGRVVVAGRRDWVDTALEALRPLIEPIAAASTDALAALARDQLGEIGELDPDELERLGLELPPHLVEGMRQMLGGDVDRLLRPAGALLAGLQVGQVVGRLAGQLLGQYDLGIPTAPRAQAFMIAPNVHAAFDGYGLDDTEVAVALAVAEAAHRRLYHAIDWLEPHVHGLVRAFAAGTDLDLDRLRGVAEELVTGLDPDDPEQLRAAMEQAARLRIEPTAAQRRVLEQLQGVVCLVGAWARHEAAAVTRERLPSRDRIDEVLRRRRVTRGDGEELLAGLLGLDLKPEDETVGDGFVTRVIDALGTDGLRRALAHPENLPDADELADPGRWLARMSVGGEVPDDLSSLFEGDAPVEASADERTRAAGPDVQSAGSEDPSDDSDAPPSSADNG
jgi:putative hydrolase